MNPLDILMQMMGRPDAPPLPLWSGAAMPNMETLRRAFGNNIRVLPRPGGGYIAVRGGGQGPDLPPGGGMAPRRPAQPLGDIIVDGSDIIYMEPDLPAQGPFGAAPRPAMPRPGMAGPGYGAPQMAPRPPRRRRRPNYSDIISEPSYQGPPVPDAPPRVDSGYIAGDTRRKQAIEDQYNDDPRNKKRKKRSSGGYRHPVTGRG